MLINNTMLGVGIDWIQHTYYINYDWTNMYDDVCMEFSGKCIVISYYPDTYIDTNRKCVVPCFHNIMGSWSVLIDKHIKRMDNE